jgi:G2/mitotic-specific cyclin 3/4
MEGAAQVREIPTDWLTQVHTRFCFLPETLYLTVDRFLSARVVPLAASPSYIWLP